MLQYAPDEHWPPVKDVQLLKQVVVTGSQRYAMQSTLAGPTQAPLPSQKRAG